MSSLEPLSLSETDWSLSETDWSPSETPPTSVVFSMRFEGAETIEPVKNLLLKKGLRSDPDMQTLEDAAALVFLEFHFAEFAAREDMDDAKIIRILRKTWKKMTERGHAAALELDFPGETGRLVQEALA